MEKLIFFNKKMIMFQRISILSQGCLSLVRLSEITWKCFAAACLEKAWQMRIVCTPSRGWSVSDIWLVKLRRHSGPPHASGLHALLFWRGFAPTWPVLEFMNYGSDMISYVCTFCFLLTLLQYVSFYFARSVVFFDVFCIFLFLWAR